MSVTVRASEIETSLVGASAHAYVVFNLNDNTIVDSYGVSLVHQDSGGIYGQPTIWGVSLDTPLFAPVCSVHVSPYAAETKDYTTTVATVDTAPYVVYDFDTIPLVSNVDSVSVVVPVIRDGKIPYDDHYYINLDYATVLNRNCTLIIY